MKVGIAGIGGIGSNVARHLAQAGLPHLRVVDFDHHHWLVVCFSWSWFPLQSDRQC